MCGEGGEGEEDDEVVGYVIWRFRFVVVCGLGSGVVEVVAEGGGGGGLLLLVLDLWFTNDTLLDQLCFERGLIPAAFVLLSLSLLSCVYSLDMLSITLMFIL